MSELFAPQIVMLIGQIGIWQILLILVAILILFGAGKIPRLMKDMGKGINAFKSGLRETKDDDEGDEEKVETPKALENEEESQPAKSRRKAAQSS